VVEGDDFDEALALDAIEYKSFHRITNRNCATAPLGA
jgi:hypothetical protein